MENLCFGTKRRAVSPKLSFKGLHGIIYQMIEHFITTVVGTSGLTDKY
jgi:hypothetical protein